MGVAPQASDRTPLIEALAALPEAAMTVQPAIRESHAHGEDSYRDRPPDAVCFPRTSEGAAAIMRLCAAHGAPVIPFGAGTSLEGHVTAPFGGVCIDLTRMNRVVAVNAEDLDARVEAGVTHKQLNAHLRDSGLFFPIDPGADATLGGMAATRASGTNAVRYGTMKGNVLGLTVVLADGRIVHTGGRARKSAAGYDLTSLFVGSEGTLGLITEVQLRLHGIPEAISSAVCQYETLNAAVRTVIHTIQMGVPVARIELIDAALMGGCIAFSKLEGYKAKPTLFFEFHGSRASVEEQAANVRALSDDQGGSAFQWAERQEERNALWQARHDAYYAGLALAPGKKAVVTDVCVPISRLADCVLEAHAITREAGVLAPMVGHAGDGNFHMLLLVDPSDAGEMARAKAASERIVMLALSMGGTSTGEHGIGVGKQAFLQAEHGEAVGVMRAIKQALDPKNLMNPGKILKP